MATSSGTGEPVIWAIPVAMGVSATMVPTLVPMDMEMKQAPRKSPASSIRSGSSHSVRSTVAWIHPNCLAVCAKAPASTNIHIICMILPELAPWLNVRIRWANGIPPLTATANTEAVRKATLMGIL